MEIGKKGTPNASGLGDVAPFVPQYALIQDIAGGGVI